MEDPSSGLRVPKDSMKDYRYYYKVEPDTGNFPVFNPSDPATQQLPRQDTWDDVRRTHMMDLLEEIRQRTENSSFWNYDAAASKRQFKAYDELKAGSPSAQADERYSNILTNREKDADAIQAGIDARRKAGRKAP
jgi:hypothetical protein